MACAPPLRSLVTGGAGFIGSHLVELLLAEGGEVRILDDLSSGRRENLPQAAAAEFMEASVADEAALARAMEGVAVVFHLAAMTAVPESIEKPRACIELNDLAVFNVYQAAAENGVRRVVFSSSSAVYGDQPVPHDEDIRPRPSTPYAIHKLLGEHYGLFFHEYRRLESVYLRYFNVYGPRQRPGSPYSGVISLFMDSLLQGREAVIFDDGEQTRDFVFVKDAALANLRAACAPGVSGRGFNIGSGQATTINRLYRLLRGLAGDAGPPPRFSPPRPGDIRHSSGPVEAAAAELGFTAATALERGLRLTWDWMSSPAGR
ncbi:MAG: NAD-dependent epimerase/dehydratase family protein [Candidatus Adiutrix sp.]|jgi:UDP-glucose 4-epimerase|nr:NAD-dependent epimerase/dehydratase family protein [Candidatus Adiutrix sp.]